MTIYISPFWCGVIATVAAEFVACLVYAITTVNNNKKRKRGDK